MYKIISDLRSELKSLADDETRLGSKHFFKEEIICYGVKTPTVSRVASVYFKAIKNRSKTEIFALCVELWKSGILEETFIACNWSYSIHNKYEPADFSVFEKWVDCYVSNWASCDTLCNHTIGDFVMMYPEFLQGLKKWATSPNRWMRRAAAVSLIIPARKGLFLKDVFEIADILLTDKDDLVQKGCGWMLKAASQAYEKDVFNYVMSNKLKMPRTALRYAIEKMPQESKQKAMAKA